MKSPAESAKAAFDKLKAVVLRARQRVGNRSHTDIVPYSKWADLPRRKAAPMANTRQCKRRAEFRLALAEVNDMYPREPRAARRNIARSVMKSRWRGLSTLVGPQVADA